MIRHYGKDEPDRMLGWVIVVVAGSCAAVIIAGVAVQPRDRWAATNIGVYIRMNM